MQFSTIAYTEQSRSALPRKPGFRFASSGQGVGLLRLFCILALLAVCNRAFALPPNQCETGVPRFQTNPNYPSSGYLPESCPAGSYVADPNGCYSKAAGMVIPGYIVWGNGGWIRWQVCNSEGSTCATISGTYACGVYKYIKVPLPPDLSHPCGTGAAPGPANNVGSAPSAGNPVVLANGNKCESDTDYQVSGLGSALKFARYYNGLDISGGIAPGWRSSYSRHVTLAQVPVTNYPTDSVIYSSLYPDSGSACTQGWAQISAQAPRLQAAIASYQNGTCTLSLNGTAMQTIQVLSTDGAEQTWNDPPETVLQATRDDGQIDSYVVTGSSTTAEAGLARKAQITTNGFTITDENDTVETYGVNGNLLTITDRAGNTQTMGYDSGGRLWTVTDALHRQLVLNYDAQGHLGGVTLPDSNTVQYGYDGQNRLTTITNASSPPRSYVYEDPNNPTALTGIIDENSSRYATFSYDALGRAITSQHAGGVGYVGISYNSNGSTSVTDSFGTTNTYTFASISNHQLESSLTGPRCGECDSVVATTYDGNGFVAKKTDFNGNITTYVNDATGRETSRTEAVGTAQQRTITTIWHPTLRLPAEIDEPGRQTTFTYDTAGNLLTKTVKDTATNAARTWTYSNYTAWGAPQTIDGPRSDVADVTQIAYYPVISGDVKSGQVDTITDALGHVTTVNSYDASGHPLQATDPNGLVTNLTYTPRGWLATRQVGSELTQYDYYPTGLLQKLTLPNGGYRQYSYNAAHQLIQVQNQLGEKIVYTPDAMGNNTSIKVYDAGGTLVQTHSRVYNMLNELYQDIGAQNQTTAYGHDNNGNLTSVTDPINHTTGYGYDALDRITQVTDPALNVTQLAHNSLDQLTSVTDPRTLVTNYTTDALGNTGTLQSPDSGTTQLTYDAAGNALTRTDAKNQVTHYQYDALNRPTLITYADSSTASFSYDQGTNGIGHLTGLTDSSGSTAWSYDSHGRVIEKDQTVGTITLSTHYGYDTAGRIISQTLPSGAVIGYTWSNGQITAQTLNGNPLVSGIAYQPFAGPISWTFANGETAGRTYDLDGRIASDPVETIGYDAASRISGWTLANASVFGGNTTFGYDSLDRITSYTSPGDVISPASVGYSYDANGNRTSQTIGGATTNYVISPTSNRITSSIGGSYGYDANGSRTVNNNWSFTYDARGRETGFHSTSGTTIAYTYNGLGQRMQRSSAASSSLYGYDEAGHLIGDYATSGTPNQETIFFGDMPVAVLQGGATYYVHSDYRNTPRQIDNAAKKAVWAWIPTPFGDTRPYTNPSNLPTAFTYNGRFPGQTFDPEFTAAGGPGIVYNGFRSYDNALGRYNESDPIGVGGGVNAYVYTGGNPIAFVDQLGLAYHNAMQTYVFLLDVQYQATEDPLTGLNNIFNNSVADPKGGLAKWDFGYTQPEDTWCVDGKILSAFQMGNFVGGFEGAAYDDVYPLPFSNLLNDLSNKLGIPRTGGMASELMVEGGIFLHLIGATKSVNDPWDHNGRPDIAAGAAYEKNFDKSKTKPCECK